jgi:hypothetical protein
MAEMTTRHSIAFAALASKVVCSADSRAADIDHRVLWYMRETYFTAGGCSGQNNSCEHLVHRDIFRYELIGSKPADQSDTA